jgi:hypothetical protein
MSAQECRPCPCCGGEPTFGEAHDGGEYIECTSPECRLSTALVYSVMEDAKPLLVERWNRRHAPASRVLKDGDVVVSPDLVEAYQDLHKWAIHLGYDGLVMDRLDALGAEPSRHGTKELRVLKDGEMAVSVGRIRALERFILETAFPEHPNGIGIDDERDHEQRASDLCRELGLKSDALRAQGKEEP